MIRKFLLVWLLAFSTQSVAEPRVREKTEYYDIEASTLGTLVLALDSHSPFRDEGKVLHGSTQTSIDWHWRHSVHGGICRVFKVSSKVNILYTLPRLNSERKDKELSDIWETWFAALYKHEKQHGQHAIEIARKGEQRIKALAAHTDCDALNSFANAITATLTRELKEMDREYDLRTNHGETEGASLQTYLDSVKR